MRLDQWLWAVRLFRTRPLSVAAIKGGHVRLNGLLTKPAREVQPGEIITAQVGLIQRTLRVVASPPSRIGAALVPQYAEDLTPPEAYRQAQELRMSAPLVRPKGMGRPTKRDRRHLDRFTP